MVGIPGRSQGCHTCRRRRVRCDTWKPFCERCRIAGIPCEGYAKGVVFLNRTADGLMRRKPFEEALRTPVNATQPLFVDDELALGPQMQQSTALTTRIEGLFLERFLASNSSSDWPSPGIYVCEVIQNLLRDWVLEPAIQALCLTKIGRMNHDLRLVQQGKHAYVLALKHLHVNIARPDRIASDGTFAAAKILNLYEVYEPSDDSARGLFSHASGLLSLLQSRYHAGYSTKAAQLILQASRYNLMISCIQKSQYSAAELVKTEQRASSLQNITGLEQSLYNLGFDVGNFIHDLRHFRGLDSVEQNSPELIAQKCISIQQSLLSWYDQFVAWHGKAVWTESPDGNLSFPHITIAHALIDYWSISIVFNVMLEKLSTRIKLQLLDEAQRQDTVLSAIHKFADDAGAISIRFAESIARSIEYCRQPEMGIVGPQRTMFANCITLPFWRSRPNAYDEVAKVITTMKSLQDQNGLNFRADIQDPTLPEWAEP